MCQNSSNLFYFPKPLSWYLRSKIFYFLLLEVVKITKSSTCWWRCSNLLFFLKILSLTNAWKCEDIQYVKVYNFYCHTYLKSPKSWMFFLFKENDKFLKWCSSGMLCNPTMLYNMWQTLSTVWTKLYGIERRHLSASALELVDFVHSSDSSQVFSAFVKFSSRDTTLALKSISRKL